MLCTTAAFKMSRRALEWYSACPEAQAARGADAQPHNCLAQAFTRQGRQECGRALLETWVGEMLHEPVTLDGYGALMIPAKVAELGPALHWQFIF